MNDNKNNLYTLIKKMEDNLDKEIVIKELKKSYLAVKNDKELIDVIKKYKNTNDNKIKEKILNNKNYQRVKQLEGQLGFIILNINKQLKQIIKDEGQCESNKW